MSDDTSDTKALQILLQNISTKINNSPVLNGGFDRLMLMMEHVQEKQSEQTEKLGGIHEGLYNPKEGLYARVRSVEAATESFIKKHSEHIVNDEKNMSAINENLKKLAIKDAELTKKSEVTTKLKTIAGDDLQKLDAALKGRTWWTEAWSKLVWLVVGGVAAGAGKVLWDVIVTHH